MFSSDQKAEPMAKKPRNSSAFKFRLVCESLEGKRTDAEIARENGIHPVTLSNWRTKFLAEGAAIFDDDSKALRQKEREIARLERMLGKKELELALVRNFFPNQ